MSHLPPMVPLHEVAAELRKATHKQRAKPPEPDDDGRARPPVLVLSPDVLAAQPERLLPATHSPLWLLPAGLSDDELMAGYGGGVW